ncbi:predicted protein [Pyrenophora tritici-repentis Pt-1C-BFP]|uniref:Uncharacterized protein n=1 Tax=Pyrenophora tritici-repentis (strain Pt-1C-BFP) TaxID=426418 RepID=B2VV27_PYRTR|nr:uncharacterized protein PTRG_02210 [Pyrenophora tritici-repentis Pt-1C-BFP]EDU41648.1 predicted protein [Pyrenophora tritici-repentis Pt-1C-BFP]
MSSWKERHKSLQQSLIDLSVFHASSTVARAGSATQHQHHQHVVQPPLLQTHFPREACIAVTTSFTVFPTPVPRLHCVLVSVVGFVEYQQRARSCFGSLLVS